MKYTIEIDTDKVFTDGQNNKLYRVKGFNSLVFDKCGLDKLEPIEKTWEDELEKHRREAYDKGYADGKADATYNTDLIDELKQVEYIRGLEDGYKGYKHLEQWFAETCFYDDEDNLFPEYNRRQADTCCLEDIITDVGFVETLNRVESYEEKKKAEEVENYHILVDTLRTVTEEYPKETIVSALSEFGFEVDKLRGEEE